MNQNEYVYVTIVVPRIGNTVRAIIIILAKIYLNIDTRNRFLDEFVSL